MKIYLAIPYTGIEKESFKAANRVAAHLMEKGFIVMSPISMCHPISKDYGLPGDYEYWRKMNHSFIDWCDAIVFVVINENGYSKIIDSLGCQGECKYAVEKGKAILNIQVNDFDMRPFPENLIQTLIKSKN